MGLGKVGDVDVVADAGAVWGVVVIAIDGDDWAAAGGGVEHERDQVRFRVVSLADLGIGVGASGVEVAPSGDRRRGCHR